MCYVHIYKKANYDANGDGKILGKESCLSDEDNVFLRNFGNHLTHYTVLRPVS